jgi:hypothetical protein
MAQGLRANVPLICGGSLPGNIFHAGLAVNERCRHPFDRVGILYTGSSSRTFVGQIRRRELPGMRGIEKYRILAISTCEAMNGAGGA